MKNSRARFTLFHDKKNYTGHNTTTKSKHPIRGQSCENDKYNVLQATNIKKIGYMMESTIIVIRAQIT